MLVGTVQSVALPVEFASFVDIEAAVSISAVREIGTFFGGMEEFTFLPLLTKGEELAF
jgi:hypothetical protein